MILDKVLEKETMSPEFVVILRPRHVCAKMLYHFVWENYGCLIATTLTRRHRAKGLRTLRKETDG